MNTNGIKPTMTPIGPVRLRLTGVVKQDSNGIETAPVNTPTVAEATAALNRIARVNGADGVINLGSDYRRAAMASGPLSTQYQIEVQAWGTAVSGTTGQSPGSDDPPTDG